MRRVFRICSRSGDGYYVSANFFKESFEVDLIIWVKREFDVQYRIKSTGGDPRYRTGVASSVLDVFDWHAVDTETRLCASACSSLDQAKAKSSLPSA